MGVSVRLSQEDTLLFKEFAKLHGVTLSELMRQSVIARIEDEFDLEAIREYEALKAKGKVKTYSHDEVWGK